MKNTILFLGSGGSLGIPVVGCSCSVCKSNDHKNKRYRSSALLEWDGKKILIDAGPDFREQALRAKITSLDGLLLTHAHQDHVAGIDDLRVFCFGVSQPIPTLLLKSTFEDLNVRFGYIFQPKNLLGAVTQLAPKILEQEVGLTQFLGLPVRYFTYKQIGMPVMGFRIADFAYVTDIKEPTKEVFEELKGVKTLIVSALRWTNNPMHFSVDEAIHFVEKLDNPRTWFTHIAHELDHTETETYLPSHIRLGYDGLQLELDEYGRSTN